jgi:hypothetical protein
VLLCISGTVILFICYRNSPKLAIARKRKPGTIQKGLDAVAQAVEQLPQQAQGPEFKPYANKKRRKWKLWQRRQETGGLSEWLK